MPSAKWPKSLAFRAASSISARWCSRKNPIMARRAEPLGPPKSAPRPERVAAFRLGLSAESRAAMLLIAKGFRIAARRWKTPVGEIDIVARRRRDLVFVEVKARDHLDAAAEAVSERSKQRIIAAAALCLSSLPDGAHCSIRSDVLQLAPGKPPRHICNAAEASRDSA